MNTTRRQNLCQAKKAPLGAEGLRLVSKLFRYGLGRLQELARDPPHITGLHGRSHRCSANARDYLPCEIPDRRRDPRDAIEGRFTIEGETLFPDITEPRFEFFFTGDGFLRV